MGTKQDLQTALKDAMRSGDDLRKSVVRMVMAAIKLAEVEKGGELDENDTLAIVQKEVKSRNETIADAQKAGRPDLIEHAEAEKVILEQFLPKQLSADELETLARQAIEEAGATSKREMGMVMKILVPQLQGRATGQQASQVVGRLLQ